MRQLPPGDAAYARPLPPDWAKHPMHQHRNIPPGYVVGKDGLLYPEGKEPKEVKDDGK